jgi:hypothetical protein
VGVTPDPRPASSRKQPSDAEERESFKRRVLALDGYECQAHRFPTDCEGDLEAHHVITQQQLRHAARHDLLWDPRNGMTVCELAHRRHTRAIQRISIGRLPARCIEFAAAHRFERLISRYYEAVE